MPNPVKIRHGRTSGRANVVLLITTVLVLVVGTELVLRVVYHPRFVGSVIRYDPVTGWSLLPGAHLVSDDPDRGFHNHIDVDSFGLREREFDAHRRHGTRRVLIVGDSIVFGSGLETKERFSDMLAASLPDSIEVINAGMPGWGNDQEMLLYETRLRALHPDLVVLEITAGNDIVNNALDGALIEGGTKPHFELAGDSLRLIPPVTPPPLGASIRIKRWLKKSRLLLFVKRRLEQRREVQTVKQSAEYSPHGFESYRHLSHWSVYDTRASDAVDAAWAVTERILARFAGDCRADSTAFLAFAFPLKMELNVAWRDEMIRRTGADASSLDFGLPYRRLSAFCGKNGIEFDYPLEAMRAAGPPDSLYFGLDSHPDARANRAIADWLRPRIVAALAHRMQP